VPSTDIVGSFDHLVGRTHELSRDRLVVIGDGISPPLETLRVTSSGDICPLRNVVHGDTIVQTADAGSHRKGRSALTQGFSNVGGLS
jgi:hypothetical protein